MLLRNEGRGRGSIICFYYICEALQAYVYLSNLCPLSLVLRRKEPFFPLVLAPCVIRSQVDVFSRLEELRKNRTKVYISQPTVRVSEYIYIISTATTHKTSLRTLPLPLRRGSACCPPTSKSLTRPFPPTRLP